MTVLTNGCKEGFDSNKGEYTRNERRLTLTSMILLVGLFVIGPTISAHADESVSTSSSGYAPAYPRIGGHLGLALPIVSFGTSTTSIGSNFFKLGLSTGITVKLTEAWFVDFETVAYSDFKNNTTDFVVDPGVLYNTGMFVVGLRTAVDVMSAVKNWGFIPIIVKGFPVGKVNAFAELDVPVFISSLATTVGLQPQFGVSF